MAKPSNMRPDAALAELRRRLPPGWSVEQRDSPAPSLTVLEVSDGRDRAQPVVLRVFAKLQPRQVQELLGASKTAGLRAPVVVTAPFLSPRTRELLRASGSGYLDRTGNAFLVLERPGLFIDTHGADQDPNPAPPARTLRGAKAGRIVRALVDARTPPKVRELAQATQLNPGYVSRLLAMLASEALVTRVGYGRMKAVDWPALLRRWAQDAPLDSRGTVYTFLEPRGLKPLLDRLAKAAARYAVTGSLAAAQMAPAAPSRLATLWIRDAEAAATRLELRPVSSGANVLLLEPQDDLVFAGASQREGVWYAAPSQVAADLLTSPGRGPAEAEELLRWMQVHEEEWRR